MLAADPSPYAVNENKERFRILFDQSRFLRLSISRDLIRECGSCSLAYIRQKTAEDKDGKRWRHRFLLLKTEISSGKANRAHYPFLKTTLFSQESMYFLKKPYITLPTRPPKRVTVPFNFGLEYSLCGLEIPDTDGVPRYDITIASGKVVLDWIPSSDFTSLLQFNFGVVSRAQFYEKGGGGKDSFILAPFTAFGIRLRLAAATGRRSFDFRFDVIPAWTSEENWKTELESSAVYRMILMAIQDQPLFFKLEAEFRKRSFSHLEDRNEVEWTLRAGVELSFQISG